MGSIFAAVYYKVAANEELYIPLIIAICTQIHIGTKNEQFTQEITEKPIFHIALIIHS